MTVDWRKIETAAVDHFRRDGMEIVNDHGEMKVVVYKDDDEGPSPFPLMIECFSITRLAQSIADDLQ
ncbi:MAG: hypothetical protein AB7O46_00280 [Xanthobacteraceae bacterium]